MTQSDCLHLTSLVTQLAHLLNEAALLAAPYETQIHALEVQKADALASLTWEIENLKALVKTKVLAQQTTVKGHGVTASYVHRETWDSDQLDAMAREIPAIRQCLRESSYVAIRYTPSRKNTDSSKNSNA